jgi:ribose transport system substrate-binding protein
MFPQLIKTGIVSRMKNWFFSAIIASFVIVGCGSSSTDSGNSNIPSTGDSSVKSSDSSEKKSIAFVTNNSSDFWTIARKGTEKAQAELKNYTIEFKMPSEGNAASQKQVLDDLIAKGVKGIALSPVDPTNQKADLDDLASKAVLFTQDSDAADSKRECYIGSDNMAAGEMAGEEVKKALPNGGKIMVFVGKADAQNAKDRFDGLKKALAGSKVEVVDLRTDDTDRARAKQNVADALVKYPDLAGCVGLWSYNGPAIVSAVKEANKVGKIQIVAFDEEDDTLAGIADGSIFSTVVQQPFEYGYQSMVMMAKVLDGDKSVIPTDKKVIVPTKVVNKASVADFSATLKELRGK